MRMHIARALAGLAGLCLLLISGCGGGGGLAGAVITTRTFVIDWRLGASDPTEVQFRVVQTREEQAGFVLSSELRWFVRNPRNVASTSLGQLDLTVNAPGGQMASGSVTLNRPLTPNELVEIGWSQTTELEFIENADFFANCVAQTGSGNVPMQVAATRFE